MSGPSPIGTAHVALNRDWSERRNSYDIELSCRLEGGCSLFGRFSVLNSGARTERKNYNQTYTAPFPANNETSNRNQWDVQKVKNVQQFGTSMNTTSRSVSGTFLKTNVLGCFKDRFAHACSQPF